jgi:hypothetical protein
LAPPACCGERPIAAIDGRRCCSCGRFAKEKPGTPPDRKDVTMTPEEQAVANLTDAIRAIRPAIDALNHRFGVNGDCDSDPGYDLLVLLSSAALELDEFILNRLIYRFR